MAAVVVVVAWVLKWGGESGKQKRLPVKTLIVSKFSYHNWPYLINQEAQSCKILLGNNKRLCMM